MPGLRKIAAVGAVAIVTAGAGFWAVKSGKLILPLPYYEAVRVIDGDTFVTKESQYIRLASTNAPELGYCGSEEAKSGLEKLILGKKLYLKVVYRDKFNRLDAFVYTTDRFVNLAMLESGLAYYETKGNEPKELLKAGQDARERTLGIFSTKCTQVVNPMNAKCAIKANMSRGKIKYFSYPGCKLYGLTLVQTYLGDRWFCTVKEAEKEGFTKSGGCN